jgi:RNA polymerase sigma-70 factor (ECF subfamily)
MSQAERARVTRHTQKISFAQWKYWNISYNEIYLLQERSDDPTLLSSVQARKTATFEELFLPHLDGAYNLARWIVERDSDAQAVVQEAYTQASGAFEQFCEAEPRAWLLTIVRNVAYTGIQKRRNDSSTITFAEAIQVTPSEKPQPGPFHEKRKRQLHEAMSRLPVELREILVLREIEGWSYKQLTSALKVPSATVMSRLSQARRRLCLLLENHEVLVGKKT